MLAFSVARTGQRAIAGPLALAALLAWAPLQPSAAQNAPPSRPGSVPLKPAPAPATGQPFDGQRYVPAVLRLSFTNQRQADATANPLGFIDLTLIPPSGAVVGRRVEVATRDFSTLLRQLYTQLSKQDNLGVEKADAPARQLYRLLIEPIRPDLREAGVTTLLISADPGLQAIPFAALHDGKAYLGESFAFSLTPSLGLMPLDIPAVGAHGQQIAAGASRFDGLNPLPLVPQELSRVASAFKDQTAATYLNDSFTPQTLLNKAGDSTVERVHVATHAEFLPGGPAKSRLFTGTAPLSLKDFATLRQRREGKPLELFALSACRTALGDRDSELGFAGLALQAGSRSAIGSLWYVDDVATSAYFIQFYRALQSGTPKAEAMQQVRRTMIQGRFRLDGQRLIGPDGQVLLDNLSAEQIRRVAGGLTHPYFWAGIELLGTPW
jgi:CHAT domain-containing protein